jgi:methyltransferase
MVAVSFYLLLGCLVCQRLGELLLARRNRTWLLKQGAKEFGKRHYPLFFLLHIAWFSCLLSESLYNGPTLHSFWYIWGVGLAVAQVLRYWCMGSLGRYWNTRILIVPGAARIRRGPYRYVPHPNYVAVCLELFCIPMIFDAMVTALLFSLLNLILLVGVRVPTENKALRLLQ